jgi:hypothetical protein
VGDAHNRIASIVYDADNDIDPAGESNPICRAFGRLLVPLLDRHGVPAYDDSRGYAQACIDGTTLVGSATLAANEAGVTLIELEAIARLAVRSQPTT